jgi:DNA-binding NarL/FixJ family response regulator
VAAPRLSLPDPLSADRDERHASGALELRHHQRLADDGAAESDLAVVKRALDAVSDGVVIVSERLVPEYRNAAAVRLAGDGGAALEHESGAAAAEALSTGLAARREVESEGRRYEIRATSFTSADGRTRVVVVVTCTSRPVPSAEAIAERHGLTPREAAVARLLAQGCANDGIVRQLGISVSTARHYTERVLVKLGTRSRNAAAALILGVACTSTGHAVVGPHAASADRPTTARSQSGAVGGRSTGRRDVDD